MKRFSVTVLIVVALLHFVGTLLLAGQLVAASYAIERGEPHHNTLWLALTWIWAPVPMFLSQYFRPLSPIHLLSLALPWSLFVGLACGIFVPRLFRWTRRTI